MVCTEVYLFVAPSSTQSERIPSYGVVSSSSCCSCSASSTGLRPQRAAASLPTDARAGAHQLSTFLDVSVSLPKAAASGSLRLFERVAFRALADDRLHAALRDHWFARAMEAAIQANDLCMVQQIHRFHPEPLVLLSLRLALEFGSLEMAQWMIEHRHDRLCCASGLENLCRSCWLKALQATSDRELCRVVRWALDQGLPVVLQGMNHNQSPLYRAMLMDADMLKWGHKNGWLKATDFVEHVERDGAQCEDLGVELVRRAIETVTTPIEVVRYIVETRFAPVMSEQKLLKSLIEASCLGRQRVVEYVLGSYLCDGIYDYITYAATRPEGAKVLQCTRGPQTFAAWGHRCLQLSASRYGHIDSLQWLFTTHGIRDYLHNTEADQQNLLERFEWVQQNDFENGWFCAMVYVAARRGYLEAVKWLHKNRTDIDTEGAMDSAAANGHLEIVKLLHAHLSANCTVDAMNRAASNGHLETVQWLYEHRRAESCVTTAMISAAVEGELDVLVWLCENTTEGCSACVFDRVLRDPETYSEKPKRRLFRFEPVSLPVFDTLRWLRDHARPRGGCVGRCFGFAWWVSRLYSLTMCSGDLQLLTYLHENYSAEFRKPISSFLSSFVSDVPGEGLGHLRAVKWVFAHYPKAFNWRKVRRAARRRKIHDLDGWLALRNDNDDDDDGDDDDDDSSDEDDSE